MPLRGEGAVLPTRVLGQEQILGGVAMKSLRVVGVPVAVAASLIPPVVTVSAPCSTGCGMKKNPAFEVPRV